MIALMGTLKNFYKRNKVDKKIYMNRYYTYEGTYGDIKKIIISDIRYNYYTESEGNDFIILPSKYSSDRKIAKKIYNIYTIKIRDGYYKKPNEETRNLVSDKPIDMTEKMSSLKITIETRYPVSEKEKEEELKAIEEIFDTIDFVLSRDCIAENKKIKFVYK